MQGETVRLTVDFNQVTGHMEVSGPLGNKVLAYGMLEMAKDVIREMGKGQAEPRRIMPARVVPPGNLRQ